MDECYMSRKDRANMMAGEIKNKAALELFWMENGQIVKLRARENCILL